MTGADVQAICNRLDKLIAIQKTIGGEIIKLNETLSLIRSDTAAMNTRLDALIETNGRRAG